MDIEAIVERHRYVLRDEIKYDISEMVRAALTELAAGYELELEKLRGWMKVSNERDARRKERIRQLEAERVPAEIRQFRHPQWADRSRWYDYVSFKKESGHD